MRRNLVTLAALAAVVAGGALLAGCGHSPGSVAGDPLAQKLIAAEQKMKTWDGVKLTMTFSGTGQLADTPLPCLSINSSTKPAETFSMFYVKSNTMGDQCPGGAEAVEIDYAKDTIYVTDAQDGSSSSPTTSSTKPASCLNVTSHDVSGDLAQQFIAEQSKQTKMADLMKAATDISGDDRRISVSLDPATMAKLGTTDIPAGADLSDVDAHADIELAADGSLSTFDVTVGAGDAGSVAIHTTYQKETTAPALPSPKCVTKGEEFSSTNQIKSALT